MKTIALMSLAGVAVAATAGGTVELYFSADVTSADVGQSVTWTVMATMSGFDSTGYFGGFVGDFIANDASLAIAAFPVNNMGSEGTTPTAGVDGNITNINVFNSALLGTNDSANPFAFYEFKTVGLDIGDLSYAADGLVSVFPNSGIFSLPVEFDGLSVSGSDVVSIVPAPGAFAVLGLGGVAFARRRR